jgi:hypothetical protein
MLNVHDTDLLGLDEWITELKDANDRVRSLMTDRESEAATKAQYKMKLVRVETDKQYAEILTCLEAAAIIDGAETRKQLFDEINARIDEYNNILAREKDGATAKRTIWNLLKKMHESLIDYTLRGVQRRDAMHRVSTVAVMGRP